MSGTPTYAQIEFLERRNAELEAENERLINHTALLEAAEAEVERLKERIAELEEIQRLNFLLSDGGE